MGLVGGCQENIGSQNKAFSNDMVFVFPPVRHPKLNNRKIAFWVRPEDWLDSRLLRDRLSCKSAY